LVASLALLGLLLDEPLHGYAMRRAIESDYAPFWKIEWARLYRSLSRLERQGLVRTTEAPSQDGPRRKIYHLTRGGRQALLRWLREPSSEWDETLVKARLALAAGVDISAALRERASELDAARDRVRAHLQHAYLSGDAGRLLFADAAVREVEAALGPLGLARSLAGTGAEHAQESGARLSIAASDDPLLSHLAALVGTTVDLRGSLGGLMALARREADVAGAHLLDLESGEYNVPIIRHLAPEEEILVVVLASRETGVMLAPGNPRDIRDLRDLGHPGIRLINRPQGTGTRLLFFARLRQAGVDPHALHGWERTAATHEAVAECVASGVVDAGPGIRAAAEAWGLTFLPLGIERYDMILPRRVHDSPRGQALMQALASEAWTSVAARSPGYDTSRTGRVLATIS
jgi:molybdate-binding protein/DNA-binding PadR family transcriptional regulator